MHNFTQRKQTTTPIPLRGRRKLGTKALFYYLLQQRIDILFELLTLWKKEGSLLWIYEKDYKKK
jgi:hypothetical protein